MANETDTALIEIDKIAKESSLIALGDLSGTQRAVALARGMNQLRRLISGDVLKQLTELAGTDLGFRTDLDAKNKAYPPNVIRDCLIEGMLRGANVVGNEINIIAGKCYLTKNYFERMLRGLVTQLRVVEGVPEMSKGGGGALVPMQATWRFKGVADRIDCIKTGVADNRIAVRVNAGMGVDAILGKAHRKLYARIFRRCTGSEWIEAAASDPEPATETASTPPTIEGKPQESKQDRWDIVRAALAEMSTLSEVSEYFSEANKLCTQVDEFSTLADLCDVRREEIRASRGERTNEKQEPKS